MQMIIEELKPSQVCFVVFIEYMGDFIWVVVVMFDGVMDSKDVFVDLGSGVGQLVVHMAGGTLAHRA
uniref:DOT1 domain-containing protein n=1 Tax=Meloidogyne javanica TaxID=6303 RepID=A0A915MU75_MELJA